MQEVTTIGLDIAKSVFQVHGRSPSHVPRTRRPGAYLNAILVPVVRRVQRHAVDIHAELHRLCSPLCQCLPAMTRLTQTLPIAAILEQPEIPIVGSDVIHLCGQTSALGIDAEPRTSRMLRQEATRCLLPPYGVATLPG